jgi:hypothetical protein
MTKCVSTVKNLEISDPVVRRHDHELVDLRNQVFDLKRKIKELEKGK